MRSLLPCPRGFFGVLRRDFAFCGTEKRGVRFFTHASRRKNLKREAARGGWIFIPCPPPCVALLPPRRAGDFRRFRRCVRVCGRGRGGAVRRGSAACRPFPLPVPHPSSVPLSRIFPNAPALDVSRLSFPRALSGRAFHGQRFFGLLPLISDIVGYFTSSCGFGYRRRRWLNK